KAGAEMKQEKNNNRRVSSAIVIVIIIIIMGAGCLGVYRVINNIVVASNVENIQELAEHDKHSVLTSIENKQESLYGWAHAARSEKYKTVAELMPALNRGASIVGLSRLYLIDSDGMAYGSDATITHNEEYLSQIANMTADRTIIRFDTWLNGITAESRRQNITVIVKIREFTVEGHTFQYAWGEMDLRTFQNELKIDSYGGAGYTNIVNADDGFYVVALSEVSLQKRQNFFDQLVERNARISSYDSVEEFRNSFDAIETETMTLYMDEGYGYPAGDYVMAVNNIENTSWKMISVCPISVFSTLSNRITTIFLAIAAVMVAAVAFGVILSYRVRVQQEKARADEVHKAELSEALILAQQANRSKTTFLNNMSHDIRTPMNAIIGFTRLAKKSVDEPDKVKDYLGKISGSSEHLLALINDVLDMSRIESGKVTINEDNENLIEILKNLKNITEADVKAKKMDFTMDISGISDEYIVCDRLRLNQVLINILSNALKYTPEGGKVSLKAVQLGPAADGRASYEFSIKDNGIGMSEEFVKTIFDPFTRAQTSTVSGIQGTGLGMAITKNIIDMMDGKITVASKENEGSEFVVTFSFKLAEKPEPEDEAAGAETASEELDFTGKRILLVEDNELNREIATEILQEVGFKVEAAENGKLGCDLLAASEPGYFDLVLMDIQMPVMDGHEAARTIRKFENKELADITILAMTANAFEEDKQLAFEAGMNGHLAKPIDIPVLFDTLKKVLK
ncbi:MAG: ATP-binding protein, partial [Eubacteriales bacterium]|nr:ATP-binding protein [Eubacteriales bacterium]